MSNYKPKDFSPIFGPDEKPARAGWYPTTNRIELPEAFQLKAGHEGNYEPERCDFFWWDGDGWFDTTKNNSYSGYRWWYGLKDKP